ncbi:hypothetical protein HMY34_13690 [Thiothrix subterranea]|uniref:hypothetical protein n=1 Tax=Thiothrix subterranea TaxID=2735563 RepID=UPI00192B5FBE|nr:hypothetical protein [Thiothrix subterranea]QQZ29738.1 hypothetical protein HMY34_13690 [Thiothrix subterranea]
MEYVLLGVLLLGAVLFLLGWLVMAVLCFQRHPVTGLLALIPVVNLLALPAMWHRVGGWVITSFIGVLLAAVAWFAGANQHVYRHAHALGMNVSAPVSAESPAVEIPAAAPVTHTIDIPPSVRTEQPAVAAAAPVAAPAPAPKPADVLAGAKSLPANALYHVVFKPIELGKLSDNIGQYVRITQKDGRKREGKLITTSASEMGLEERLEGGTVTRTLKTADIREVAVMTHEQGKE